MTIRQVREVPSARASQPKESLVDREMREFVRLGYDAAVIEVEGRKATAAYNSAKSWCKRHPKEGRGICVGIRKGVCYVWREAGQ